MATYIVKGYATVEIDAVVSADSAEEAMEEAQTTFDGIPGYECSEWEFDEAEIAEE